MEMFEDSFVNMLIRGDAMVVDDRISTRRPAVINSIALIIFMSIKDIVLMKKLTDAQYANAADGQELQKKLSPEWRSYPHYWLNLPHINGALITLIKRKLIRQSDKGYVNGTGADVLFSLTPTALDIIQDYKSSDAVEKYIQTLLNIQQAVDPM